MSAFDDGYRINTAQDTMRPFTTRRFWLEDKNGNRRSISDRSWAFLSSPEGLGYTLDHDFITDGNGFFDATNIADGQGNVVGDLIFSQNPYTAYREFVDYVAAAGSLKLIYCPQYRGKVKFEDQKRYYTDVKLDYLQKGEIQNGVLTCGVSFRRLSLWYKQGSIVFTVTQPPTLDSVKDYEYRYPHYYTLDEDTTRVLRSGGHVGAALDIYVKSPFVNPKIELLERNSRRLVGRVCVSGLNLPSGHTLHISTHYDRRAGIWLDGYDAINYVDIRDNIFFKLPPNTDCIMKITDENNSNITATVNVFEYFRTV